MVCPEPVVEVWMPRDRAKIWLISHWCDGHRLRGAKRHARAIGLGLRYEESAAFVEDAVSRTHKIQVYVPPKEE